MQAKEISYFILSLIIISIENKKLLFGIFLLCLFDFLLTLKKKGGKINLNFHYIKHLNNKSLLNSLLKIFLLANLIVILYQVVALNYWKEVTTSSTIKKLIIFMVVIFIYFVIGQDTYLFDTYFFKKYFYPSKKVIYENIILTLKSIPPIMISNYKDFEIQRIFENLLITHERINYEIYRLLGRISFLIISSIGIMIYSKILFFKICLSFYILLKYIINHQIIAIYQNRQKFNDKQNLIYNNFNYILNDLENMLLENQTTHKKFFDDNMNNEDDIDLELRKSERIPTTVIKFWTLGIYSLIAIKIYILTNKFTSSFSKEYAAGLAIGAINIGWIGNNFNSIYTAIVEINLRLGVYSSYIEELLKPRNLNNINYQNKIKFTDDHLTLFNQKIDNNLTQIIGPSGIGKTTLLNQIFFNNSRFREICIYIKQNSKLDFLNRIPLNIVLGFNSCINKDLAIKALNIVENKIPIDKKIINLSGGERQRIILAMNVYKLLINKNNIKFILMDEGDTNLDSYSFDRIIKNLIEIKPQIKIIFISHKNDLKLMNNIKKIEIV